MTGFWFFLKKDIYIYIYIYEKREREREREDERERERERGVRERKRNIKIPFFEKVEVLKLLSTCKLIYKSIEF